MEKQYTIYGNPVSHSKSPQMHNAGFRYLKNDSIYKKTHIEDGNNIRQNFILNNISGANITVPYKEVAFEQADEVEGLAVQIGAVNTYIKKDNKIIAYNTDAPGFMKAIEEFGDISSAIILGAGGTAKAIAVAFAKENIKTTILNRSSSKLDFFKDINCETYTWEDFKPSQYDIVINATSAGLKDEEYPVPLDILLDILSNSTYAIDCIYGKMTPFLQKAQENNLIYKDGEDMLLYQGVIAFELFTGIKADKYIIDEMRKGLKEN